MGGRVAAAERVAPREVSLVVLVAEVEVAAATEDKVVDSEAEAAMDVAMAVVAVAAICT